MVTITSRFTAEELHEMTVNVVKYNNETVGDDEVSLFSASSTRMFYVDQHEDLYLMEVEGNTGNNLIKIDPEQQKAMFVLYECVADALKLEKE